MRKIVMMLMCIMLAASQLIAQTRTITGKVTDDKGAPVPNASITVKNSTVGTTWTWVADGTFTLRDNPNYNLVLFLTRVSA
jgi:FlaG/FlaF family flagellin (archaellin)